MTINLTKNEDALLNAIITNEYTDGRRGAGVEVWTKAVCGTRSRAATLGHLIEKGLAASCDESYPGENDACCWATEAGFAEWQERQVLKQAMQQHLG